jgi:hypothetical protein
MKETSQTPRSVSPYRLKQSLYWAGRRLLRTTRINSSARLRGPVRTMVRRACRVHPPVTDDLAGWCAAHGVDSYVLSAAEDLSRCAPTALGTAPHPSFERRLTRRIEQRFLACLPGARVWGSNGLVVLPDGSFAVEAIYGRNHLELDPAYLMPMPSRVVRKEGDYCSLLGKFSNAGNYYHWIHDGLLRLHGTEQHLPRGVKYLVPPTLQEFQRETLSMLGLREEQLVPFRGDEVWECERLWFASMPPSGAEVPDAVTWLRDRLFSATSTPSPEPKRRLYISRRRSTHARVVNEEALNQVLQGHGFEIIEIGTMSVAEQVRLFSQAESIVAPHGAGETNMLFASATCKILELLEPQWASDAHAYVFWTLAETLGQCFRYVVAESVVNPNRPSRANLYVPPEVLDGALACFAGPRT